jgi:ATP-dependent helicase IRC3
LKRFNPEDFKCIIIDEAHHSVAPSYRRILDHFGAFSPTSHLLLWGCSATLRRNDHLALGDLFEKVVYHVEMKQMINKGWLCKPDLFQVFTEFNIESVSFDSSGQDFSLDDLSLTLNTPKRNELIAKTWLEEAHISNH